MASLTLGRRRLAAVCRQIHARGVSEGAARSEAPRVVLVTGASRGIGRAAAHRFASAGDRVIVHYSKAHDEARRVAAALPKSALGEHLVVQADLEQPGTALKLMTEAIEKAGVLDVLVANHGLYYETPFETSTAEEWGSSFERLLRLNLIAPAEIARAFADHLVSCGRPGSIVFVGSRGGIRGEPVAPAYGASKAGLHALSGSLAQAFGRYGIRVATVAPGFIATDMAKATLDGPRGPGIKSESSWNRVGTPEECANAIFFLASEGATWCTGTVLDCNGASFLH